MAILQNFRPMTRAKMAQLSLPDIRAYATAYGVPADVIEHGTVDELLDLIFELRPRHPREYPVNTPHLFMHKVARTQRDRDEEFRNHKPYAGFAHRENLARFRRAKTWIGRPFEPNGDRTGAVEGQSQLGDTEGQEPGYPSAHYEDLLVMGQSVASSSRTPTYEQPNPLAEYPQEYLSPFPNPSHLTPPGVPGQDLLPARSAPLPSNSGLAPSRFKKRTTPGIPIPQQRGDWPSPIPPAPGFEVTDDPSILKSALEEHQEAMEGLKPSCIIVDDELFDLEFTPDMTQVGKEAVVRERYAISMSNHKMIEQMLADAEVEMKQALWQLTVLQPQLDAAHENVQRFIDESAALISHPSIIRQAVFEGEKMAKDAWEADWNEEWISSEGDEKEEETMRKIAQARAAGVQLPPSPPVPRNRKRTRDEDDELEYADEGEPRAGTPEPDSKRPRTESPGASTAPSTPSPKKKDKGKGRALVAEDSYTLPFPSSSFYIPPPPMPRFGPKDRCNVYPVYKPAVPGYGLPQPTEAEDGNQSEQHDGDHLPPSDETEGTNDGPEPDQGQAPDDNGGEERISGDGSDYEAGNTEEPTSNTTEMRRGAPPPAEAQPEGPRRGSPWQVLRYDRAVWGSYSVVTERTRMPSNLKRPVDWSIMGSRHPKSASFREWDDELEEQNPWHQGGRPILKQ